MDIKVIAYGPGPLSLINEDALLALFGQEQSINVQIIPQLMFRASDVEKGIIGLQMYVEYVHQEQKIMTYGFVLTLRVDEWAGFNPIEKADEEIRAFSKPIWEKAFTFASGALVSRVKNEAVQRMILSTLEVTDDFVKQVRVERQD